MPHWHNAVCILSRVQFRYEGGLPLPPQSTCRHGLTDGALAQQTTKTFPKIFSTTNGDKRIKHRSHTAAFSISSFSLEILETQEAKRGSGRHQMSVESRKMRCAVHIMLHFWELQSPLLQIELGKWQVGCSALFWKVSDEKEEWRWWGEWWWEVRLGGYLKSFSSSKSTFSSS